MTIEESASPQLSIFDQLAVSSIIGSVSHPAETGLLIPSGKRGGLNGSTQHSARNHRVLKTKRESFDRVQPDRSVLPGKYRRIN